MKAHPMIASCRSGIAVSTLRKNSPAATAQPSAMNWISHGDGSWITMLPTTSPSPAICATARSIKMMPRRSTSIPRGACVSAIMRPAATAGPIISRSSLPNIVCPSQQSYSSVKQREQIAALLVTANGVRKHDCPCTGFLRQPLACVIRIGRGTDNYVRRTAS